MEFMSATVDHKEVVTQDNLRKAFSFFSKKNGGEIAIEEYKIILPSSAKGSTDTV